jgi:YaiO family outer membrane protein
VTREAAQDVSFKVLPETVLTAGARYARYYGGTDAWSWSAGASQYFKGGMIAYRFTSYDIEHLGHSVGHLGSFKLNDRGGSSQLWVGHGTSIHDAEFLPVPQRGTYTSAELKRSQKLTPDIALNVGLRRSWYDTPEANYHGTGIHLGLTFGFQPRSTPIDEARNPSEGRSQSGSR